MIFGLESGLGGSLDFGVSKICFVGTVGCGAQTWLYGCGVMLYVHHKTFGVDKSFLERVWGVFCGEDGEKWRFWPARY